MNESQVVEPINENQGLEGVNGAKELRDGR